MNFIIAALIGCVLSGAGGFFYGKHVEAAEQARARESAVNKAITDHNETAAQDMNTAYEVGLKKGRAAAKANQNRQEFSHAIAQSPRLDCRLSDTAFGLLHDAIESANNSTSPAGLPDAVPATTKTGKPAG